MFPQRPLCDPHQELVHSKWDLWTWKLENHWTYALNNPTTNISIRTHTKDIQKFQYECTIVRWKHHSCRSFSHLGSWHQPVISTQLLWHSASGQSTWHGEKFAPSHKKQKLYFLARTTLLIFVFGHKMFFTPKLSSLGVWWNQFSMDKHVN